MWMRHHGHINAATNPTMPAGQEMFTDEVFLNWGNAFAEWANATTLAAVQRDYVRSHVTGSGLLGPRGPRADGSGGGPLGLGRVPLGLGMVPLDRKGGVAGLGVSSLGRKGGLAGLGVESLGR